MNKKHPFFRQHGFTTFGGGQPEQPDVPSEEARETAANNNASVDGLPPFNPEGNPLGGLFPEDADENFGTEELPGLEPPLAGVSDKELDAACKERICPSCPVTKEAEDARLRALADLENARKRLAKEREDMKRFATEGVLTDIIPALDNLDLALQHAPKEGPGKDFVLGVEMTRKLLLDALKKHGLEEVGQLGQPFDPALHEAVGVADVPEIPVDHVCNLLSKGYSLQGRLLRPARVMVCKH